MRDFLNYWWFTWY